MAKIFAIIAIFVCSLLSAQTQFEQGMGKALGLWKEGKATEASAQFERIASVEKANWLPNYYIAFVNTIESFRTQDKSLVPALLEKAQKAQTEATIVSPNNPELMVMQAMIYTAWIVYDPMTNGMKYSQKVMEQYYLASAIAPNNPRVVFSKADFQINSARYTGADTKPLCEQVAKSIELFATFKPESELHPNWGLDRAKQVMANCGK
ncbi:MAG: hypothetical protein ABI426_10790 [Flavobacterium sp.]